MYIAAGIRALSCWSVRQQGVITCQMFLKDERIYGPSKGQSSVFLPVCVSVCLSTSRLVRPSYFTFHLFWIMTATFSFISPLFAFISSRSHVPLNSIPFPSPSFSSPLFCVWINDTQNHKGLGTGYTLYTPSPSTYPHSPDPDNVYSHWASQRSSSRHGGSLARHQLRCQKPPYHQDGVLRRWSVSHNETWGH